jgi:hypothetical protein
MVDVLKVVLGVTLLIWYARDTVRGRQVDPLPPALLCVAYLLAVWPDV